jgi:hypothetical protein
MQLAVGYSSLPQVDYFSYLSFFREYAWTRISLKNRIQKLNTDKGKDRLSLNK